MLLTSSESIVLSLAEKMRDPMGVRAFAMSNLNSDPVISNHSSWHDLSLSNGYPSLILLFSTLRSKGLLEEKEAESIIYGYVVKIKETLETKGQYDLSLFSGVSGICYAIQLASREGKYYQRMLNTLQTFLLNKIEKAYLEPLRENINSNHSSSSSLHDLVQGLAGIGRYILENLSDVRFYRLAEMITKSLIAFSQFLVINGEKIPGWLLSPNDPINILHPSMFPKGSFNLGLAHGIPGILAFLSIASLRGINVEKQKETIRSIANWIRDKSFTDHNHAIRWPYAISWEEEIQHQVRQKETSQDGWCYGVPGIARSLCLAGKALKDEDLKNFAIRSFRDVFLRSKEEWQLPGPNLCHGIGGLLLITKEMSKENGCKDLSFKAQELQQLLLSFYNPDFPLGFKDIELYSNGGCAEVSKPGLLEGTVGILLALLISSDSNPAWQLPFLINE